MTRDIPFPVASGPADLPPSGSSSAPGAADPAAPVRLPAEISSALENAAPATAAALALGSPLDFWAAIYTSAPVAEGKPLAEAVSAGEETLAEPLEGRALALWKQGRADEAIQMLERQIALEKNGPPAVLPTAPTVPRASEDIVIAVTAALPARRLFRPAALIALVAGAALLAGAALWNGRYVPPADAVAQPALEVAATPVETALQPSVPAVTPIEEPRPAGATEPPSAPDEPVIPEPVIPDAGEVMPPAPADAPPATASVAAEPTTPETDRFAAVHTLTPESPAAPADARVPKRRPDPPAYRASAARHATPRPPRATASNAPRSRLAERRAAAQSYAARRRAAAERRSAAPQGPTILLGGRGLR